FMGEEHGETHPFLYFVSHGDSALADAVRDGRREEFAAFAWQGAPPDPNAAETFARSRLDWAKLGQPAHRALVALYRDCLALRRSEPALRPGAASIDVVADAAASWCVVGLAAPQAAPLRLVFNCADAQDVPLDAAGLATVLSTEDVRYGGSGARAVPRGDVR